MRWRDIACARGTRPDFSHTVNNLPVKLDVNPEASLIATKSRGDSKIFVAAVDVKSGKRTEIYSGGVEGMASDDSGRLYLAELNGRDSHLHVLPVYGFFRDAFDRFEDRREPTRCNALRCRQRQTKSASIRSAKRSTGQVLPPPGGTPKDLAVEP